MANTQIPNFEIPPEMRQFAEQSFTQARKAFEGFMDAARSAVSNIEDQTVKTQGGMRDVGEKAVTFAQRNVAASFVFAQKLVQAKDVSEVMQLQADYMQAQMQALKEQSEELSTLASKAAQGKR